MDHTPTVLVGVTDHLDAELQAMLLAKYSRSYGSIVDKIPHTEQEAQKVKDRLKEVYINYGHRSVGQLGHTTIFFEGVSMLAAIAIEVSELFNGQESSTRYIDYTNQPAVDLGNPLIQSWQELWRDFYKQALGQTIADLKATFPKQADQEERIYNNTIKARAFDICGGILPAGFTTCVGFTGSFDVLNEHLGWMMYHPLQEVRQLAEMAADLMMQRYPNGAYSVDKLKRYEAYREIGGRYSNAHVQAYYYESNPDDNLDVALHQQADLLERKYPINGDSGVAALKTQVTTKLVLKEHYWGAHLQPRQFFADKLKHFDAQGRQAWQKFPRHIASLAHFRFDSEMDFRSYRDIHRHRNGHRPLPLLSAERGIHPYYYWSLSSALRNRWSELQLKQALEFSMAMDEIKNDPVASNQLKLELQYAIPMGMVVPYYYSCDINQLIYLLERRTGKDVHQTVRMEMMALHDQLKAIFPDLNLSVDLSADNFTLKRGTQTFKTE